MKLTATHKMGVAALIMGGSVFLSRLMGLVRDKVVSWQFGAGAEADIYFAAFVVPDFINHLLAGGYVAITLIPLLSKKFEEDPADGWRFFSAVFCWATLGISTLTLITWVLAPHLTMIVAPGFNATDQARLVTFLRIILPAQMFFLPGACLSALLYLRKQFFAPALTPLVYNGCIILGGLLLSGRGMEGFCWGVLGGAALGAFLLPLLVTAKGGLSLEWTWKHPLLKRYLWLALPLMVGQSVVVLDEQFVRIFGSLAGEGAVSLLNYARRIMMVPVGVVAQAAGVASFPFLAALMAKNDEMLFNTTLNTALRGSLLVVLPLVALMIALAAPGLGFIFEGGRFNEVQTLSATPLLQVMLLAVPFWTAQQIMGRAFYARQNTMTPAVVGTIATVLVLPAYPLAAQTWGAAGVALATTLSLIAYTVALMAVWGRKHGAKAYLGLTAPFVRCLTLSTLSALPAWGCSQILTVWLTNNAPLLPVFVRYALVLTAGTVCFALPYVGLAKRFLPEALHIKRGKK